MHRIMTILCFFQLISCIALGSGNLLKNTSFRCNEHGIYPSWRMVRGTSVTADGYVEFKPRRAGEGVLLFQRLTPAADTLYQLEVDMCTPNQGDGRVYAEATYPQPDGKTLYRCFTRKKPLHDSWQHYSESFRVPSGWRSFYVAIRSEKDGVLRLRNLRLTAVHPSSQSMGWSWNVRSPHTFEGGVLTLRGKDTQAAVVQGLAVVPGKSYKLQYTVKGLTQVIGATRDGWHLYGTAVSPEVEGSVHYNDLPDFSVIPAYHRFKVPLQSGIRKIALTFSLHTTGTIQFSDFRLVEVTEDPTRTWRLSITSPSYRGTFYGQDQQVVTGQVTASPQVDRVSMKLDGGDVSVFPVKDGVCVFQLPFPREYGKHSLQCDYLSSQGKILATRRAELQRVPDRQRKVIIKDTRNFVVHGKAFFPIVIWGGSFYEFDDEQLGYLAGNGVNTILCAPGISTMKLRMLDQALRHGMKLILSLGGVPRTMEEVRESLYLIMDNFTPEVRNHPALLGYFLKDEPLWVGYPAKPLQAVYKFMREFDPYHPVYINAAPRYSVEDLRPYGEACDLYGLDIYPIPYPNSHSGLSNKTPSCIGEYARRYREVVYHEKPVLVVQQGFSWSETTDQKDVVKRYPTASESRFMALDALVNGGSGFSLWGMPLIRQTEFFTRLMSVTRDIHCLSALFMEGKRLSDLETGTKDVQVVVLQHENHLYYIGLNRGDLSQTVKVKVAGESIHFYWEGVTKTVANGQLSLTLPGFTASVFGASPLPAPSRQLSPWTDRNPYAAYCQHNQRCFLAPPYTGDANWIWDGTAMRAGSSCRLAKRFQVSQPVKKASLALSVDDEATVYVNGTVLGTFKDWKHMRVVDISSFLKPGANFVVIDARDGGVFPCAVLAEISCGKDVLASGSDWKVLPRDASLQEAAKVYDKAVNAHLISPYGGKPWGKKVKLLEE